MILQIDAVVTWPAGVMTGSVTVTVDEPVITPAADADPNLQMRRRSSAGWGMNRA